MSKFMLDYLCNRIHANHYMLQSITDDLTLEQFTRLPGPQAPPIGWHLWHIARWEDRVQAAFPPRDGVSPVQIWEVEELAVRYGLDASKLGLLQSGIGMAHEAAARLPHAIGQEEILNYARQVFAAVDDAIDLLTVEEAAWVRPNCRAFTINEKAEIIAAPAQVEPLWGDLEFLCSHSGRHLGMIEALRGAQGMHGSASV